jgi:hypothetical protein
VNLVGRADECRAHLAEFAGVGHHDYLFRLLEHLAKHQRLFSFQRRCSAVCVKAGNAQENLVEVHIVEKAERGAAGKRERPRPGNHTAGKKRTDARLVAELHADVDGVGDHLDVFAVAQTAANVRGGGACG